MSGPCARDVRERPDITTPGFGYALGKRSSDEPVFVVERYLTNSLGQMAVVHPAQGIPLRFAMDYLPLGHDFSI